MGRVFEVSNQSSWMCSHATVPIAYSLGGSLYRVYFSTRDNYQRNQVGYAVFSLKNEVKLIDYSLEPVLSLGELGHFDCDGIYATSIVEVGDELWLYYAGWNAGLRGLFYCSIGLAISQDGGLTFSRMKDSPILGRDKIDPWAVMAPFVLRLSNNNWIMWYSSGVKLFHDEHGKLKSKYNIKTALSQDGVIWEKTGKTAIDLGKYDSNIARACVLPAENGFEVWYPFVRTLIGQYRIGYGQSSNSDGLFFNRLDDHPKAELSPSLIPKDWDGEAVTYPYVFRHNDNLMMFYNGNDFGRTGFGLARWC